MSWRGESAPSVSHAGIFVEGLHAVLCYAHRWWNAWDRQAVSDAAGKASFFVWLFAQSPQIYENYARSSVDGLSPTFLLQWMGGDITNLIGCLLTNQLAFQVAIAVYFCLVDTIIGIQFICSWRLPRSSSIQSVETEAGQVSAAGHTVEEYANLRLAHAQQYVAAARRAARHSSQLAEGRASSGSRQQPSTLGLQREGSTRWAPHLLSPTREQSVGPERQAELHDYGAMADSLQSEASTASGGSLQRIWGSSDAAHKTRPAASFARFREQARARSIPTNAKLLSRISTVDESVTALEDGESSAVSDSESPDAEPRRGRGMIRTAERIWTNFVRQSVEGLSMLLFVAAALGNTLYSISILVSPLATGTDMDQLCPPERRGAIDAAVRSCSAGQHALLYQHPSLAAGNWNRRKSLLD
ncbi:Predicted membrane protein [Ceraceosorus bombacis]|uniref:Predicted membrane protein n=1 Tax=Ceraceosorus bombacis TaxID=401625 RepID=A0A0P1B9Y9_9BASI|nr:Predicted membrane protein [Ceraceosorus bombacis]